MPHIEKRIDSTESYAKVNLTQAELIGQNPISPLTFH
jgi:hypothetical protein